MAAEWEAGSSCCLERRFVSTETESCRLSSGGQSCLLKAIAGPY